MLFIRKALRPFRLRRPTTKAPEVLTTPGASFLGSGGGIRERASLACATKRSFVANPRPPGYEKVSAFLKNIETTQSYRLTQFSRCAGWSSLRRIDPTVTPPLNELRSQKTRNLPIPAAGFLGNGATPESALCRCRCGCRWQERWRRVVRGFESISGLWQVREAEIRSSRAGNGERLPHWEV